MMKEYIIDSLLLLLKNKAYNEISIGEICVKAGVNRSTYYRHFNSKEDIVYCFFDNIMEAYLSECQQQKHDLDSYLKEMFSFFLKYKNELLLLYRNELSLVFWEVLNRRFGAVANRKNSMVEQYRIVYHIGGIFNYFLFWFSRDMKDSPEELIQAAHQILPADFTPYLLN